MLFLHLNNRQCFNYLSFRMFFAVTAPLFSLTVRYNYISDFFFHTKPLFSYLKTISENPLTWALRFLKRFFLWNSNFPLNSCSLSYTLLNNFSQVRLSLHQQPFWWSNHFYRLLQVTRGLGTPLFDELNSALLCSVSGSSSSDVIWFNASYFSLSFEPYPWGSPLETHNLGVHW